MNDAQRYRTNAVECLSAAKRCGPAYRDLTLANRGVLVVARTPADSHGRASRDLERGQRRYGGGHEPVALSISSREN
jgi:hypothetical protein